MYTFIHSFIHFHDLMSFSMISLPRQVLPAQQTHIAIGSDHVRQVGDLQAPPTEEQAT